MPPAENQVKEKWRPVPRSTPVICVSQSPSKPGAITRFGSACASAPMTAEGRKWPTRWRPATAAGKRAFRIEPSGAITRTGRKLPSLFGTSGEMTHLMPYVV